MNNWSRSDWDRFNDQFRETEWERRDRQAKQRRQRTANGQCWQCAKPIAECQCPNVTHKGREQGQ
jgi:hypothetical protein